MKLQLSKWSENETIASVFGILENLFSSQREYLCMTLWEIKQSAKSIFRFNMFCLLMFITIRIPYGKNQFTDY
ncbi:unnamed protein product [Allacma fusca]|uniref:Uncharacterized protein n=1 Tax=Allacma fusca TaxID=39272 RepID=A0A8J2P4D1_9HEXA|nr:unnamed protein product [Allacma fusca]